MTKRRTILKGAAGALGLLVLLGAALAPRWINLAPVRTWIESAASSGAGGTVRYERIDLSWLPRPEVVVRGLELSAPGKARGAFRSVSVSPTLLPLL
jgi:hypothetical protein